MKQYFDQVKTKLLDALSAQGYELGSEDSGKEALTAILQNETDALRLDYIYDSKLFVLGRGSAGCAEDEFGRVQSYIFDKDAGDGAREVQSVVNEFLDSVQTKSPRSLTAAQKKKKDKDSDESTAVFFANRVATVLPECREPLLRHKAHYEQLLPRWFCEEVVTAALREVLANDERAKKSAFFELVNSQYAQGDLDTRAIIMQVIMPVVTDEKDVAFVEGMVSPEFKKAWSAARRWFGKEVKPEKTSAYAKMSQFQAETLQGGKR